MATFKYLVVAVLILIATVVWVTEVHPAFAVNSASTASSTPLSFSLTPLTASAVAAERPTLPVFDGNGVVFIDTTSGAPGTPYIIYANPRGGVGIKELLFLKNNEEACQVTAGEYPCARDITGYDPSNSDASPVPSGTLVHVVGGVDDQGIVVQSLAKATTLSANMIQFSTPMGSVTKVSNGTSIAPTAVKDDASCTLGIGCFAQGTQRVQVTVTYGDSTTTTQLVPGSVFVFGKSSIVLLSVSGTGSSAIADFLVGSE